VPARKRRETFVTISHLKNDAASRADVGARVMLVVLCVIWGSTWPVLKLGLNEIPPLSLRALSAGLGAFGVTAILPPGRAVLSRLLPAPGAGPSREQRERGGFRVAIHAKGSGGDRLTGVVEASRDPGYGATSIMIGESALCLAEDELLARGGVLTTASCMGMILVERLRKAGMTFRVESSTVGFEESAPREK